MRIFPLPATAIQRRVCNAAAEVSLVRGSLNACVYETERERERERERKRARDCVFECVCFHVRGAITGPLKITERGGGIASRASQRLITFQA